MLEIDGSIGEGGGQIIRTSLCLSMATGEPVRLYNIRAGRKKSGLLRQHLTSVRAAAEIGNATISGDVLHSREITFAPGAIQPGEYRFAIGTAGSTTLVLQTVLPVLLTAKANTQITLEGGTHNAFAPPFEFLQKTFLPLIEKMGPKVNVKLDRPGFYPAGGGKLRVQIQPSEKLKRLELSERGAIRDVRAFAMVSNLPVHIAERELKVVGRKLDLDKKKLHAIEETRSHGPGNVVWVEVESEQVTEVITAFGQKGITAEKVAAQAAREANQYLAADVPVGEHLADQLLLPLALGNGGVYLTQPLSSHSRTNFEVIQKFLDVKISVTKLEAGKELVEVRV